MATKTRGPVTAKPATASPVKAESSRPKRRMVATFPDAPNPAKAAAMAKMALKPSVNAALVVAPFSSRYVGEQDLGALMAELSTGMKEVWAGDMKRAEAMLYGQAHALQAIFMNCARRAEEQGMMSHMEIFMRMALKAQNQCRMTLETLATIKNPPVVFARQANINNGGQQQVNNGTQSYAAPAHAANPKTEQTELLEASDEQRLDTGAAGTAGGADSHMEAVGAIHRPPNR